MPDRECRQVPGQAARLPLQRPLQRAECIPLTWAVFARQSWRHGSCALPSCALAEPLEFGISTFLASTAEIRSDLLQFFRLPVLSSYLASNTLILANSPKAEIAASL